MKIHQLDKNMRNKKKSLRQQHIWFSIWNAKTPRFTAKYDAPYRPERISHK